MSDHETITTYLEDEDGTVIVIENVSTDHFIVESIGGDPTGETTEASESDRIAYEANLAAQEESRSDEAQAQILIDAAAESARLEARSSALQKLVDEELITMEDKEALL